MGYCWIGIYIVFLLVLFLTHYKKYSFDVGCCLLFIYLICGFMSFLTYDLNPEQWNITLFPFLFLAILFYISLKPILLFDVNKISHIERPPKMIINGLALLFIICTILSIKDGFGNIGHRLVSLVSDSDAGREMYDEAALSRYDAGKSISNIFSIVSNLLYPFEVLLACYMLTLNDKSRFKKIIVIMLFSCIILGMVFPLLSGERGTVVKRGLLIVSTFFLLKKFFSKRLRRTIIIAGISIMVGISIPFLALTFSRFGDASDGGIKSIYEYAGQNILNFNEYALDNNGIRYGDRTIPVLKKVLMFENVPNNYMERRSKYPNLKINDEVFVTYIGDFVLDFGPFFAFIIIVIFSMYIIENTKIRASYFPFHKLVLLHFYMSIISQGVFLFSYADTMNYAVILYFIIYFTLKYLFPLTKKLQLSH